MTTGCTSCTCGCCEGIHRQTPLVIENRAGLSAIAYRTGTWASFRASMHAALTGQSNPLSGKLTTRDDDDFSIALLDAFATVADVLTFYQERIANESYLRTARERLSLVELARLIGYDLAPAVAAETWLAFTIDPKTTAESVTIDAGTRVQSIPGQNETPQTFETSRKLVARAEWNTIEPRRGVDHPPTAGDTEAYLAGTDLNLKPGDALAFEGPSMRRIITNVDVQFDDKRTHVTWASPLESSSTTIAVMRVATPLFAHNAVMRALIPSATATLIAAENATHDWDFKIPTDGSMLLDGPHPDVRKWDELILAAPGVPDASFTVTSVQQISTSAYAVSGKATRVTVVPATGLAAFNPVYRQTIAYAGYEELTRADWPRTDGFYGQTIELASPIKAFDGDRVVLITGAANAAPHAPLSEQAIVSGLNGTTVTLSANLGATYDPKTMKIFANVVEATHGETVKQSLGSGDATVPFQRFALSRAPLTFVASDESPRGADAELSVYVNNIKWHEAATLFGASPRDRVYRISRDADEKAFVQFGDGRDQGSRLLSGHDNVRAVYRTGAGASGNVRAGQLTLLMTQPFGVKDVNNPRPAVGGVDAEVLADARTKAPRTVMTIDRVVSIRDYESFAATFRGVAKGLATWTWLGTAREVVLTIAGPNAEVIGDDHPVRKKLIGALARLRRPYVPLRVEAFEPVKFRIKARLAIDPDHVTADVMAAVRTVLEETFSFDARTFGQAVALSEVIATMQNVDGVVSVDVDRLYRAGQTPAPNDRLAAQMPKVLSTGMQRAQILMLDDWTNQDVLPKEEP